MLTRLLTHSLKNCGDLRVADVRIGLCYTAVMLDDGNVGLAYMFRDELLRGCAARTVKQPFAGQGANDILFGITSSDFLKRTVGIAAANAVLNREHPGLIAGDVLDIIDLQPDDVVGMVGYFGPLVSAIKRKGCRLLVFEKKSMKDEGVYPDEQACALLPECTVALITATSIINATFEALVEAARSCRVRAVLGPSTPLAPEVFAPSGVTLLSGVLVADPGAVLRTVSEGGGMHAFKHQVRKVNLTL